ncbi:hypothetical protein [Arenicella chitinivorans]|uniref:hypothetical protein n=1 Tax=Arenicella chitinivorans TaxID=1329800 RepID=UPI0016772263|nr:hypothetical protein [Arenicella chitinivorans]
MKSKLLPRTHLATGLVLIGLFMLTGQYMRHQLQLSDQPFDAQRMMYRASHIYLLLVGIANTVIGCYWQSYRSRWGRTTQLMSSVMFLSAPIIFSVAFIVEPASVSQDRPFTWLGCVMLLAATGLLLASRVIDNRLAIKLSENKSRAN